MLTVKASAKASPINGIGLFADEKIPKGTITWKFDSQFDIVFDPKDVAAMSKYKQDMINTYAYLSKESGKYVYSIDDSRFTNHSSKDPSVGTVALTGEVETCGIALRDIEIGEELTINYRLFDVHDENSGEAYLNS
jgi:uncharacterized protein